MNVPKDINPHNFKFQPRKTRKLFEEYLGRSVTDPTYHKWVNDIDRLFPGKKRHTIEHVKLLCAAAAIRKDELSKGMVLQACRLNKTTILGCAKQITNSQLFSLALQILNRRNETEGLYLGKDFPFYFETMDEVKTHVNSFYRWSQLHPELPAFDRKREYTQDEFNQWREFILNKPGRNLFKKVESK
ncbi:hypothetical protein [Chroococcidiopsis sp.]|uniref:hypothetical protein n=1 Tax=Chroococcidiopsis sp. TaxID=3088168 RepID=UPI003F2B0704